MENAIGLKSRILVEVVGQSSFVQPWFTNIGVAFQVPQNPTSINFEIKSRRV